MGHDNVKVLDGGLPEWIRKGYPTHKKQAIDQKYELGNFKSNPRNEFLITYDDICKNVVSEEFILVDARSRGRFNGTEDEPRAHLKSGKIPKSVNIPYTLLLDKGKFKSIEQIKAIFDQHIDTPSKLVFSCGSGMTACIVMLASEISFRHSTYLYDGSWTEYATKKDLVKK